MRRDDARPGIFELSIVYSEASTFISCSGELDVATTPKLEEALELAIERHPSSIVVRTTEISFVDHLGLEVLHGAMRRCERLGIKMRIIPGAQVARVARLMGLDRTLVAREEPAAAPPGTVNVGALGTARPAP